jgi:hypothetical protein
MPHFGLMDADALGPERAALMRAKLHIRAGRRRLRQGKVSYAFITLYDALVHAMEWHLLKPELRARLNIREGEDLGNERTVYGILVRSGVLDGRLDYQEVTDMVDGALAFRLEEGFDREGMLGKLEDVFTQLGVLPFDEEELPPEDPSTY